MGAKAPAGHRMPYRGLILIIVLLQMVGFSFFAPVSDSQGTASIITGTNQDDLFGWNVSGAGDVNGDGFDDIVVGAPGYGLGRGRAYIYFCGPWFSGQLKAENANITLNGTTPGDRFGWDVSGAGDVNKDGLDDVIIGAPGNTSKTGTAYIYFGRKFELASLKATSANFTISGEYADDLFGASVSGAGDVNNDGYDDVLVGSPGFDKNSGKAYIFLGNGSKKLKLDASTADVMFWGENLDDCFGFSVSDAGNVNKDEYDDVIIGAPGADRTYLYFGGDPMNAWVQTSQADFYSAETNVHIDTTQVIDGEAQLETFYNIKAMMAYFDGSNPPDTPEIPKNRTWNQQLWTGETEAKSIGSDENYWFVVESGTVRKNEKILAVSDAGIDIIVQVSEGLSWGPAMELTDVVRDNKYQGFDVAYESLSGDAILAYYNDTSPSKLIPKYRIWNGTAWSSEMDAQPVGTGDIHWVLLASNPLSDEILMVTLDRGNNDIYAQVWNGSSWGNAQLIESQTSRDDNLCFDVVYEQQTGNGMIVWGGNSGSNKNLNYRRWTGNWFEPAGIMPAADNQVNVVKLAADPKTDYIIMGHLDNGRRIDVQIWNGSAWSAVTEVAPGNAERNVEHCFDVAYEATGDREGIVVYGIGDHRPVYRLINGTSVGSESFVLDANPPDNGRNPNWILLDSDPQTSEIMLTYLIDDGGGNGGAEDDIGCEVWNGTEWKLPQRVELNSTRNAAQHFDVAYTDTSGFLVSAPYDALIAGTWGRLKWTADIPRETSLTLRTRTSSDGVIWSEWSDWFGNGDRLTSPANRWIQFEAYFETTNVTRTPVLNDVTIELNRANLTIIGTPGEGFGWSVSRAWDVHGDGYDDIIVGAPFNGSANGSAYIFSGARAKSEGDGDRLIDLTNDEAANVTLIGDGKDDLFGYSVSSAGNASSDKYPDVVIGAPGAQKSGTIYIFFGSTSMVSIISASNADAAITGDGELECFGWSVAWAGNISSTGYDEIAIGAPFYDEMVKTDAGRVYIFNLHYQPDLMINDGGDDEYQGIPTGSQVNVSWVTPGNNISLWIEVENDGTLPDTYEFNITANILTGWVWKITDNVTFDEINDGTSISLSSGENRTFTMDITVPISALHSEESWVIVTVNSQNDTIRKDAVKASVFALDVTAPEILDTTSGIPSTGDIFAISATVTDDVIVNNVHLYYWFDLYGGGMNGPYNVTMDPGYTKDVTVPSNAITLHYNISANDTSDNWNETGITSISVMDNDQPSVNNTTSGSPTTGEMFTLTTTVTDNIEVDQVILYYWFDLFGGGTDGPYSIPMDPGYTKDINVPTDAIALHYNISANDTSDNWNETGEIVIGVSDTDLPEILDTTIGTPTTDDIFAITAVVTDNIVVDEVHLYYWFDLYGGGINGPYNVTMDPGYTKDVTVPSNAIALHYNISANDTGDNWNETGIITLGVLDNDLPLVIDTTSGLPTTGDLFPITATITDNIEVGQVVLYYWFDIFGGGIDGPYYISMDPGYSKDITVPYNAISLHYNVSANDTSDNLNEIGIITLGVLDNDLPLVIDTTSGLPTTGDLFPVTATVNDNIEVGQVVLYYWFDIFSGGTNGPYNIPMDPGYTKDIAVPADAVSLHYNISANDTNNNWNETGEMITNVLDNDLPVLLDISSGFPTTGDPFVVTVSASDNIQIDGVHVLFWFETTGGPIAPVNLSMNDVGGGLYERIINVPANALVFHYRFYANDTMNNWNGTGFIILNVLDNDLPDITDTTIGAPTTGDVFLITATVTDNIDVDEVHLYYWFDLFGGGMEGPYNLTMDPGFTKDVNGPSNAILLHYHISVNDTSNNWNQTGTTSISVLDNDKPSVIDTTSGSPTTGDLFSLTASVSDNIDVNEVHIYYWFDLFGGGMEGPYNLTMDPGFTKDVNGPSNAILLHYHISVNDTSNNWNQTNQIDLVVLDNDLPDIIDTTAGFPSTGDMFTLTASINDNIDVDGVYLLFWYDLYGGGTDGPYNMSMNPGYTKDVIVPSNAVWFHYFISANDTSDNWNQTSQIDLIVIDNDLPDILDTTAGSPTTGDVYTITASASDNIDLSEVYLYYWFDLFGGGMEGPYNLTMDPGYTKDVNVPSNAIWLHYDISVKDTSNNWNDTGLITVNVNDNDLPHIDTPWAQPAVQVEGNPVNITVVVVDDMGVDYVWVNVTLPGGAWFNISMNPTAGNEWFFESMFTDVGSYAFTVWAADSNGNINGSDTGQFEVTVTPPPGIDYIQIRSAANGKGQVLDDLVFEIDDIIELYASGYNHSSGYVGDIDVSWSNNNIQSGSLSTATGTATIFTALGEGSGMISANHGSIDNVTTYTVLSLQNPTIIGIIPPIDLSEDFRQYMYDLSQYASDGQDPKSLMKWVITGEDQSIILILGDNTTGKHLITLRSIHDMYGDMQVTYWLVDSQGNTDSQKAWINISPVNDPPEISDCPELFVHFDSSYSFDYTTYIRDVDNAHTDLELTSDDTKHTSIEGLVVTYTYPQSMVGTETYIILTVMDGIGYDNQLVKVTITSDYPPVTVLQLPDVTLYENETQFGVFDLDDYITDPDGDSLYMSYGYTHIKLTINDDHKVDFSAPGEWSGVEMVTFRAQDPIGAIVEQTITVTVIPVNDPPVIKPLPPLVIHYNEPYIFDLFWYISDNDNIFEELVIYTSNPDNVTAVGSNLWMIYPEYWEGNKYPYTVDLTVYVSDGIETVSQTTTVTVNDNFPPYIKRSINDAFFLEDEYVYMVFDLDDYFGDVDGNQIFYTSGNDNITVVINENHTVDIWAPTNWFGSEYITIRARDGNGAIAEDTLLVTFIPVNDPPLFDELPAQVGQEGSVWVLDVSDFISDPDNDKNDLIILTNSPYISIVGHMLVFNYPHNITEDTIWITVSDGEHETSAPLDISIESSPAVSREEPWLLYLLPIIMAALLILALIKKRAVYNVEDLFLISKGGLLISHVGIPPKPDSGEEKDQDIVAAMFVAVQEFIKDAFSGEKEEDLKRMDYGEKTVLICRGNRILLSAFITGQASDSYYQQMKDFIEDIEERFDEHFGEGNNIIVKRNEEIDTMMAALLEGSYSNREWKKKLEKEPLRSDSIIPEHDENRQSISTQELDLESHEELMMESASKQNGDDL